MKKIILIISCLAIVTVGLSGCGKKAKEKVAENLVGNILEKTIGKNASVNINDGNVQIHTDEGSIDVNGGNVKIKSKEGNINVVTGKDATSVAFPADVYKYPGAEVTVATVTPSGYHFGLETTDKAEKVFNACKTEMEKMGWKANMAAQEDGQGMIMMAKDGKLAQFVIGKDREKTAVSIMFSDKK